MFSPLLEPLSVLGMIIVSNQAIALNSIVSVTDMEDGYLLLDLINGKTIQLNGADVIEFENQVKNISQAIRRAQAAANSGLVLK